MRILVVDDECLALDGLMELIKEVKPYAEVVGFRYVSEALDYARNHICDVAFLDIELPGLQSGTCLAKELKTIYPKINIIFATGHPHYMGEAFEIHASGYVLKPVTKKRLEEEFAELRIPVSQDRRLIVQTFGNFEVLCDGVPLPFKYAKSKELFAYLVDRRGALCTVGEMKAILFEDDNGHETYFKSIRNDLLKTLQQAGCDGVTTRSRGMLGVVPSEIHCDYFDFIEGKESAINSYQGEYMAQYSWAEFTHAALERKYKQLIHN